MITYDYKNSFNDHYSNCFYKSKNTSKAKKDIVGESYENLRKGWIRNCGLDIATKEEKENFKNLFGGAYDADQYIVDANTRILLALEEDKGHYVDKCFFKRALINAVEMIAYCLKKEIDIPYFILSCPTRYKDYESQMTWLLDELALFDDKVVEICKSKFKFFYHCSHGRTDRKKYLTSNQNPFIIEDNLVQKEKDFFSLIKG